MNEVVSLDLDTEPTFEEFWHKYPAARRQRKSLCRQKWVEITSEEGLLATTKDAEGGGFTKVLLQATPAEIMEGLIAWVRCLPTASDYTLLDEQFIVTSPVWLNQGRWEDSV